MTYAMSDLHGRYDRYIAMLEKINFSVSDTLYVLGDSIDGEDGAEPVKLFQDMMKRKNVINLQGNHELWALPLLRPLKKIDFSEYGIIGYRRYPFKKTYFGLQDWLSFGGMSTLEDFVKLSKKETTALISYIESWGFYKDITVGDNRYILSHAGLHKPDTLLEELPCIGGDEWTFAKLDYDKRYFPDRENIYLVTGHNSTENIHYEYAGRIYRNKNHINIDTGTFLGRDTGCICFDTDEEFYV